MSSSIQPNDPQNLGETSPLHGQIFPSVNSSGSPQSIFHAQGGIANGLGFAQPSAVSSAGIGGAIVPVGASNQSSEL